MSNPAENAESRTVPAMWLCDSVLNLKFCLKHKARLNRWECSFVESLGHQNFPLTAKQQNVRADIIGKILSKRRR